MKCRSVLSLCVGMAMVAGACGSGDESSSGTTAVTAGDTVAVVDTAVPAASDPVATEVSVEVTDSADSTVAAPTGDPILIGVTAPTNNVIFDAAEMLLTTQATADYINAELGGIAGRPVELVACETVNSPESVLGCASTLIDADPILVIPGPDLASPAGLETYGAAGMPLVGGAAFAPPEFMASNRVLFQGWSASLFPGLVHFAVTELGAENVVAVSFDDPNNKAILDAFMAPVMQLRGLPELQFIPTSTTAPDFTAPLAAAISADADAILAYGLPCEPIIQAYASLGSDIPLVMPDNCTDPALLDSVGDAAEGVYFVVQFDSPSLSPDDPETQLYQHVIDTYADDAVKVSSIGLSGFSSLMAIHDVLDGLDPATFTHESILETFHAITSGHNLLVDGDFNCAAPPIQAFPSLCNASAILARYQDGVLVKVGDWVGAADMFG